MVGTDTHIGTGVDRASGSLLLVVTGTQVWSWPTAYPLASEIRASASARARPPENGGSADCPCILGELLPCLVLATHRGSWAATDLHCSGHYDPQPSRVLHPTRLRQPLHKSAEALC